MVQYHDNNKSKIGDLHGLKYVVDNEGADLGRKTAIL